MTVPVPPELAFAVSRTTAPVRYRWDPFVRDRIGVWLLGRDIRRRIAEYVAGCADPEVLAAARRSLSAEG